MVIFNIIQGLKPVLLMVVVQTVFAGVNVLYKLADDDGMSISILIAYRFLFATAFIVPLALLVERKKRPKLTWMILLQALCCGLFGCSLSQYLFLKGLSLTSATFASATTNLTPAITFVLAVCFRVERLGWKTTPGITKIMGTVIGLGGAMLLTFYKGVDLHLWKTNTNLLNGQHHPSNVPHSSSNTVIGFLLTMCSCIGYSIWLIIQTNMVKTYPCPYTVTALSSTMAAVQALVFGLCTERDWDNWKLGWNVRLLTVAYSGMLASALMYTMVTWVVQIKGPLFVSSFVPLTLVLVTIAGSLILNESLYLGSVLGSLLIIVGLYVVLWGKGKEVKKVAKSCSIRESRNGTGGDDPQRSGLDVAGNSDSKHSSLRSVNSGESRRIEVV